LLLPYLLRQYHLLSRGFTINEEIVALHHNQTWELTIMPSRNQVVSCRWVYAMKFLPNGLVE